MLRYTPTPVQEIHHPVLREAGVKLLVKREDLNHLVVSGNKWWKLKYNLEEAVRLQKKTLLTFGGAFSNHIYATAAAAKEAGIASIGIIRGEEVLPLNKTLHFAHSCGMSLHYVPRDVYRYKHERSFLQELTHEFGDCYIIPEGGTNSFAVKGCSEFARQHLAPLDADYVCLAAGTGGTMAGVIDGLDDEVRVVGFPVLKGGDFLQDDVKKLLHPLPSRFYTNWELETEYHFGGYAKSNQQLLDFIRTMKSEHDLPLDHVYTAKLLWGILDCVAKGKFNKHATIVAIHSGGLQGSAV